MYASAAVELSGRRYPSRNTVALATPLDRGISSLSSPLAPRWETRAASFPSIYSLCVFHFKPSNWFWTIKIFLLPPPLVTAGSVCHLSLSRPLYLSLSLSHTHCELGTAARLPLPAGAPDDKRCHFLSAPDYVRLWR